MAAIFKLEQHRKNVKKHCVFDRFHAKVVVLLEASSNFKVRLADEISSRAFFLRTSAAECKQKCAGVFLLSAVFLKMLKNLVFC